MTPLPAALPSHGVLTAEHTRWFLEEVRPHEASLRVYLRSRFPWLTDPDDLVQETYLRLLRARQSGKAQLSKDYLFTVARNAAFDLGRRNRVISIEPIADIERLSVLENRPSPADAACREQEIAMLVSAVQALPERCRQVITLRKIYGLSHREIATRLGIAENTVNVQITHGMARLRDHLRARGLTCGCPS